MPIVLKITYDDDTFRFALEDRPSYDAVDIAVRQLKPGALATFVDAAGLPKQLSAASFEQFLATARVNANGRRVLRLQLAHPPTPTAAVAAAAPAPTEPATAPTPQCSAAPAAGLMPTLQGKRIAIMPRGSRGDVQPFVALGSRLMAEGCRVLVLTNTDHIDFVAKFGMEAVGVAPDCRKDHEAPEFQHGLATGDWRAAAARRDRQAVEELPPLLVQELLALREFAPDLIYATPLTEMRAWLYSNMMEVPMLLGTLQPIEEGLSHGAEEKYCGMGWHNGQAELAAMKKVIQEDFKELKLDPAWTTFWSYRLWRLQPPHPVLVHWSPALNEAPARKCRTHKLTGFLVVEQLEQEERFRSCDSTFGGEALRELQAFLDAGERPVYMGWGSILLVSPEHMACLAVRALRGAGFRGVVLGGWAGLAAHMLEGQPDAEELLAYARENVLFVQSAPHEWLFPRCAATVHHGGAGTTAAALRAGVPTVITPMGFDQPDNAKRVQEAGCGLALEHFPKVTPEALAAALVRCAADEQMTAKCSIMGEFLRAEDGTGNAAAEVERFLQEEVSTGVWRARLEELRVRAHASAGPLGPIADPASWRELAKAFGHSGHHSGGAFH